MTRVQQRRTIRLREAATGDIAEIAALHAASWRCAYAAILDPAFLAGPIDDDRLECWTGRLRNPPGDQHVLVAEGAGTLLGFVCVFADADTEWGACVDNLHVARSARGQGLGARLLRSAASWVCEADPERPLHLWVFEQNTPARQFYARLGGAVVETTASLVPSARGALELRFAWRRAADLAERS